MRDLEGSIITYTGRVFWPLDSRLEDINALDICHALSNQCRFTGHTRQFYSVAEHSCRVHDILPDELKLTGLLHDASEAYLMDLARPVKEQNEMELFRKTEDKLMYNISFKFGLSYPFHKDIKIADTVLLVTEYRDLMCQNSERGKYFDMLNIEALDDRINPWTPAQAKSAMMERLEKLGVKVTR